MGIFGSVKVIKDPEQIKKIQEERRKQKERKREQELAKLKRQVEVERLKADVRTQRLRSRGGGRGSGVMKGLSDLGDAMSGAPPKKKRIVRSKSGYNKKKPKRRVVYRTEKRGSNFDKYFV